MLKVLQRDHQPASLNFKLFQVYGKLFTETDLKFGSKYKVMIKEICITVYLIYS